MEFDVYINIHAYISSSVYRYVGYIMFLSNTIKLCQRQCIVRVKRRSESEESLRIVRRWWCLHFSGISYVKRVCSKVRYVVKKIYVCLWAKTGCDFLSKVRFIREIQRENWEKYCTSTRSYDQKYLYTNIITSELTISIAKMRTIDDRQVSLVDLWGTIE